MLKLNVQNVVGNQMGVHTGAVYVGMCGILLIQQVSVLPAIKSGIIPSVPMIHVVSGQSTKNGILYRLILKVYSKKGLN